MFPQSDPKQRSNHSKLILPLAAAAAGLALTGVLAARHHPSPPLTPALSQAPTRRAVPALTPVLPPAQLAALHVDETGHIPILMYHSIGAPARRGKRYDSQGLNIAPETFRHQLSLLYAAHCYPVNMRDILTPHLNVPAGKTPVVLTFDDARGTQFHYLSNGKVDPNCAVGILEAFHSRHADWPLKATFYVLPKSAWNPVPFWQPGQETKKLRTLVADGFEVANHTTTHRPMTHLSGAELCWEMAECQEYVKDRAPGATMDTMALPGGAAPKNHALWNTLLHGRLGKIVYHNRCIMMAWGGPSHAWVDRAFDPDRVTRLGSGPGWIEHALKQMASGRLRPYVSDGNPDTVAVPRAEASMIDPKRLGDSRLVVYGAVPKRSLVAASKYEAHRT
jgi:peptidoglycan/xylan/chitin deacetylase (PgdA/CDA1 family)